jgi:hypothetical protein
LLAGWCYRISTLTHDPADVFHSRPKEVLLILMGFNDVRYIHLADQHSPNLQTSWYGESIGRYDGDSLVVDTMGLDDRTSGVWQNQTIPWG